MNVVCENCGYIARLGEIECPRCFADLSYAEAVPDGQPLGDITLSPDDLIA